jgi:2-polyprenyl-6-hydroxyphenyl methylase/3-demethylubiquinone-9 3-methyltransferase
MSDSQYDFRRCKLCGESTAAALYTLGSLTVYGCAACDFHATDFLDAPPENDRQKAGAILDEKSRSYIEERLQAYDPLPGMRLALVQQHGRLRDANCLDIGAGVGQFMTLLAAQGAAASGLEPSPIRREFADRKFGLELFAEQVEIFGRRPQYAGHFDFVTLWDVIEHVNFPVETVEAALRVLKPGGLLFVDTPSRDAASYRLSEWLYRLSGGQISLFLQNFYSAAPFGHKQIFRPEQLVRLAEGAGFEVVSLDDDYETGSRLSSLIRPGSRLVMTCRRPGLLESSFPDSGASAIADR